MCCFLCFNVSWKNIFVILCLKVLISVLENLREVEMKKFFHNFKDSPFNNSILSYLRMFFMKNSLSVGYPNTS